LDKAFEGKPEVNMLQECERKITATLRLKGSRKDEMQYRKIHGTSEGLIYKKNRSSGLSKEHANLSWRHSSGHVGEKTS